jgi:hypothetical protein
MRMELAATLQALATPSLLLVLDRLRRASSTVGGLAQSNLRIGGAGRRGQSASASP